jgi:anti-sigma regulatory factor (Ser/Thr protein kinase)
MTGRNDPFMNAVFTRSFDARSLRALRQAVNDRIGNDLDDLSRSEFVLAVHEIATNAVRHGGGAGELRLWRMDSQFWCEIVDQGTGIPRGRLDGRRPKPGHIGGWGLWLARQICSTVEIETGRTGTRVRLCYPLGAA